MNWVSKKLGQVLILSFLILVLSGCTGGSSSRRLAYSGGSWPGIITTEDRIFVAYQRGVYALDEDGDQRWRYPEKSGNQNFFATPALDGETLYVTDYSDAVIALEADSGEQIWIFNNPTGARYIGGATVGEDLVYAAAINGTVFALNKSDGTPDWQFSAQREIWSTPLLIEDTIYLTTLDRHVYALDATTGEKLWQFPAEGSEQTLGAMVGTPVYHDGILYFGSFDNHLYALDVETQETRWSYEASNWIWNSPLIVEVDGEKVIAGTDLNGLIFVLDEDGEEIWTEQADGPVVGPPTLLETDSLTIFVTSEAGQILQFDLLTGDELLSEEITRDVETRFLFFPTGTDNRPVEFYASPVLFQDWILLGSQNTDGLITAYELDGNDIDLDWEFTPQN